MCGCGRTRTRTGTHGDTDAKKRARGRTRALTIHARARAHTHTQPLHTRHTQLETIDTSRSAPAATSGTSGGDQPVGHWGWHNFFQLESVIATFVATLSTSDPPPSSRPFRVKRRSRTRWKDRTAWTRRNIVMKSLFFLHTCNQSIKLVYAFRCMRHMWCTAGILYGERSLLLS